MTIFNDHCERSSHQRITMSRRKQSNPKPLLKNKGEDDQELPIETSSSSVLASCDLSVPKDKSTVTSMAMDSSSLSSGASSPTLEIDDDPCDTVIVDGKQKAEESSILPAMPKLRLNTMLASDPALQPEAKDIKNMRPQTDHDSDENHLSRDGTDENGDLSFDMAHLTRVDSSPIEIIAAPVVVAAPAPAQPPRIPIFMCTPCGIRFSSLSTLEAHQTYYCSHRNETDAELGAPNAATSTTKSLGGAKDSTSEAESSSCAEPPAKISRIGKQYACTHCSYSADKKVSLNRHMRMHQSSPVSSIVPAQVVNGTDDNSSNQLAQVDRYCTDCDIRFSSTKTYRAHKQHYCGSRHRDELLQGASPTTTPLAGVPTAVVPKQKLALASVASPSSDSQNATSNPPPYLVLPTNPAVVIPYSLIHSSKLLPSLAANVSNSPDSELTCYILQNGVLKPIAKGSPAAVSAKQMPSSKVERSQEAITNDILKIIGQRSESEKNPKDLSTPLDLSVRKLSPILTVMPTRSLVNTLSSQLLNQDTQSLNPQQLEYIDRLMEGKENLISHVGSSNRSKSITPEQIVCAPSLPGSPPLTPSPKHRQSSSPRDSVPSVSPRSLLKLSLTPTLDMSAGNLTAKQIKKSNHISDSTHNTSPPSSIASPLVSPNVGTQQILSLTPGQPQVFVKQGVSKCKECNIVFCQYENYMAHKKHYCSFRNMDADGKTIVEGQKSDSPTKPLPSSSPNSGPSSFGALQSAGGGTLAYQQLICAACGIKFGSLDNLKAHQMYYCPKRNEFHQSTSAVSNQQQQQQQQQKKGDGTTLNLANSFKCPICDVVSANGTEARRHMETHHGGAKAYRCTICRYKGNTMRGMRTHIRMHFDKKSNADFNEESYITSILDEELANTESSAAVLNLANTITTADAPNPPLHLAVANPTSSSPIATVDSGSSQTLHTCDLCNYSSTYKGNVVRHIKLVHSTTMTPPLHTLPNSVSPPPRTPSAALQDDSSTEVATKSSIFSRISIKSEPEDDEVVLLKVDTSSVHIPKPQPPPRFDITTTTTTTVVVNPLKSGDDSNSLDRFSGIPIKNEVIEVTDHHHQPTTIQFDVQCSKQPDVHPMEVSETASDDQQNYCEQCDIKFNYLNTFLAHKRYYCKSATENKTPSPQQTPPICATGHL